jgi:hypothetical protein
MAENEAYNDRVAQEPAIYLEPGSDAARIYDLVRTTRLAAVAAKQEAPEPDIRRSGVHRVEGELGKLLLLPGVTEDMLPDDTSS